MDVLFWGTYDTGKPRTRILRSGLRTVGVAVRECHAPVWEGIEDKSQVEGRRRRLGLLLRWLGSYPRLVWRFLRATRPDFVLVGFPGVLDVIVLAPFARLRRVPIVWDMFMSLYDTVVLDRRLFRRSGLLARLLHRIEGFALRRARVVFLDTATHARRIEDLFGIAAGSCAAVFVGAELERFAPPRGAAAEPPSMAGSPGVPLRILFYGQFIPLHGIETIVSAARMLRERPIEWTLVGRGQQAAAIRLALDAEPLPKLRWVQWVNYSELGRWIAAADVCLGIFGTSEKAASVIPNKVFQVVAAGRPLITRDSPAIRELLDPVPEWVTLVPPGDPAALAAAVEARAGEARPAGLANPALADCHAALVARIGAPAIGRQFLDAVARPLGLHPDDADAR